jgi:hypothetical protein
MKLSWKSKIAVYQNKKPANLSVCWFFIFRKSFLIMNLIAFWFKSFFQRNGAVKNQCAWL